jgi:endoglucanase
MIKASKLSAAVAHAAVVGTLLITVPAGAAELVKNGGMNGSANWWWTEATTKGAVENGQLCADVPAGTVNPWDVILGQNDISLQQGQQYKLSFKASGDPSGPVRAIVGLQVPPYTTYFELKRTAPPGGKSFSGTFTSPVTLSNAQVAFQVGGASKPWKFCVDNVSLQ